MSRVEMVMPQMGESIAEGTILKWMKKEGDVVERDENVLEISTDKVDSEIPSPAAGRIVEIKAKEGETVPVGQVIAILETEVGAEAGSPTSAGPPAEKKEGASTATQATAKAPTQSPAPGIAETGPDGAEVPAGVEAPAQTEKKSEGLPSEKKEEPPKKAEPVAASAPSGPSEARTASAPSAPVSQGTPTGNGGGSARGKGAVPREHEGRFFSPLVRAMAREEVVSLDELMQMEGSGRGGRVTKDDLLRYLSSRPAPVGTVTVQVTGAPAGAEGAPKPSRAPGTPLPRTSGAAVRSPLAFETYPKFKVSESRTTPDGRIDLVPMDNMRQKIAEHMVRSKATSPHVASVTEVDMTAIVRHREANLAAFDAQHGFKLTYTAYIVQAAVKALLDYPMVNASVEDHQILVKRFIHLGVAVALENGLIVPVVKHAEEKNLLGLARSIHDLANRARSRQLKPDEVAGGTFTLTNMGSFGNLFGIPIINQPQVGILGAGAIVKRPVVVEDMIAIRDIMYLSLSYDHRVVDGALGGLFIQRVRQYLESAELVGSL